ncbi:Fc.00g060260.m01.CDS01 [Cosmosporella sp. VM-42]
MGCLTHRKKQTEEFPDQKWEYINLRDFKSGGCGTIFAYIYLWLSLIISVAVYAVDSFTAVNLIVFNRWSSKIDPAISLDISKWIFSVCIILSFVNLAWEGFRATKVIKKGDVAACYMDNLAVRWESIRVGSGQGWRRFLVFAELTKSKKGAEYIALFTYFSFQTWIRVILCSGPRQVLNAFTLKSVYEAKLSVAEGSVEDSIAGFFNKIKALAEEDYRQALILSGMCFTLVVWVFSALFLLTALMFWIFFLCHWIPRADGGLTGYCQRKVTKTLMKIVTKKVNKALAREEANRMRAEFKAAKKNGDGPPLERMATLPTLPNVGPVDEKLPTMPMMGRNDTMVTLPPYTSRPGTPGGMDQKRPIPTRNGTMASTASYSSRAPLIGASSDMGYGRSGSPAPTMPDMDPNNYPPARSYTSNSNFGPNTPLNRMASNSNSSMRTPFTESPGQMHNDTMPPFPPPTRSATARTMDTYNQPLGPPSRGPTSTPGPREYQAYNPDGRSSPAESDNSHWGGQPLPRQTGPTNPPMRSATGAFLPRGPQYPPQRNLTAPMPARAPNEDYFGRSSPAYGMRASPAPRLGTPQGQREPSPFGHDVEAQRDREF